MTELNPSSLEQCIIDLATYVDSQGFIRAMGNPTQLIVHPDSLRAARRILFPHNILKRRKGARGRAMTLKWRRK